MADAPEKTFSCSLHAVSYNGFKKGLLDDVDYFTFQLYGPNKETYYWNYYENAYNSFVNWGYPKDKILLSYGVLLVNNGEEGYKDLFEKYGKKEKIESQDDVFKRMMSSKDKGETLALLLHLKRSVVN